MTRLNPGDAAPDFRLLDQDERPHELADTVGSKAILFFYPEAMTPGCTTEACDFRDSLAPLQQAGYAVIGISRDSPEKLRRFRERDHLDYPLLSDPDRTAHEAYGAWGEKQLYGKTVTGVLRSTFVLDEAGRISHALYNTRATGHVAMLRKKLGV